MTYKPDITFFGAAGEVTGSCTLVEAKTSRILIDFGLFQGRTNQERNETIPKFHSESLDAVILTHAHVDHCGRLPLLAKLGYRGPIYMTPATQALLPRVLYGSAHVQRIRTKEHNLSNSLHEKKPLFIDSDVSKILELCQPLDFNSSLEITNEISLKFYDNAHILGSATISLEIETKDKKPFVLVLSGDIGNQSIPPLPPPQVPTKADCLILESTYGSRLKDNNFNPLQAIVNILRKASTTESRVLIPTFALGRCQQILYRLGELSRQDLLFGLPVYLDFRTAKIASSIYSNFPNLLSNEAQKLIMKGIDPLNFKELVILEKAKDAQKIRKHRGKGIVIAGSGFCEGGPIIEHLKQSIDDNDANIILAGHQIENTPSKKLADGISSILLDGYEYPVNATIHTVDGFSGHADQSELLSWIKQINETPKEIILNHGDLDALNTLKNLIDTHHKTTVTTAVLKT